MTEPALLWEELAQARRELVQAARNGQAPPRAAVAVLTRWPDDSADAPDGAFTPERMAAAWGQWQLIMVEGSPKAIAPELEVAWHHLRRLAEAGFQALLTRPEWVSLHTDLHEEVLPRFVDAVAQPRWGRLARCTEAVQHLRILARRTGGLPHIWRIRQIAAIQYPHVTPDGWYEPYGHDYIRHRVQAVMRALLEHLREHGWHKLPLLIGYAARTQADLAALLTDYAVSAGQPVYLCEHETPTPALIHYQRTLGADNAGCLIALTAPCSSGDAGAVCPGFRYHLPSALPLPASIADDLTRRAAELVLDAEPVRAAKTVGDVRMIDPLPLYTQRMLTALDSPAQPFADADSAWRYWRQEKALVIIDAHDGGRTAWRAVGDALHLPCAMLPESPSQLIDGPEPRPLATLIERVRDAREERHPLIGIALRADTERLTIIDETGAELPGNAIPALLADYLFHEAYPGQPGVLARTLDATHLLDRIADAHLERHATPPAAPAYQSHPAYHRLVGDPAILHGAGIAVAADSTALLTEFPAGTLLLAGDGRGAILARDDAPYFDGLWAALCLLQLCARRQTPVRELWRRLQDTYGILHNDGLEMHAPDAARRALVNRYLRQHERNTHDARPPFPGYTVQYAGGIRDRFIEFALHDAHRAPVYLVIRAQEAAPAVRVFVEGPTPDTTHRLLLLVAERLERLIVEALRQAEHPWKVVEILAETQLPLSTRTDLPGTLNCRLAQHAYARLQELAHPGREAPDLLRFVTDRLSEVHPEKARVLVACHLGESRPPKSPPRPPQTEWEVED